MTTTTRSAAPPVADDAARLRLLLGGFSSISQEMSLTALLGRIADVAQDLTQAQYVALGVLGNGTSERLRTLVTRGMSPTMIAGIERLPEGAGLLGLLIDQPEPLRLSNMADHASSSGFPAGHPPMKTFLGVPIRIRNQVFGNLYFTEKAGGADFTDEDQAIVIALAAAAGVAIENAQLYEEAERRERWLAATAEVAGLLSHSAAGLDALQVIADRARAVAGAELAWLVSGRDNHLVTRVVAGTQVPPEELARFTSGIEEVRKVLRTGVPKRIDDLAVVRSEMWPALGPGVVVPLRDNVLEPSALVLAFRPGDDVVSEGVDLALALAFSEQAALALQVARAREVQLRQAVLEDRDRLARELHVQLIQRLVVTSMEVQEIAQRAVRPEVSRRLSGVVADLDRSTLEMEATLAEAGAITAASDIQSEVTRIVERAVDGLGFRPQLRFEGPVRTRISDRIAPDLLAVLGEALVNVAKHAEASSVLVLLSVGEEVVLTVCDNGRGMPEVITEDGLTQVRQRAARLGGTSTVISRPGDGTTVEWIVPVE